MQMDPATGLAQILSRSKNGALFVAERGLGASPEDAGELVPRGAS
jgi:hypothetical protein